MPFDLPDFSDTHLATLLVVVSFALSAAVSCHAVLYKRDTRAVITWVGLAWLAPYLGAIAYFLLGINRVRRRAAALGFPRDWDNRDSLQLTPAEEERAGEFVHRYPQFIGQTELVRELSNHPLLPGNSVTPLRDGDEAYPDMLAAIAGAQKSVSLLSYIFDSDRAGDAFFNALCEANARGVEVRVLIDAMGVRYRSSCSPAGRS